MTRTIDAESVLERLMVVLTELDKLESQKAAALCEYRERRKELLQRRERLMAVARGQEELFEENEIANSMILRIVREEEEAQK